MIQAFPKIFTSNTYLVWDENSLDAMIIDCATEPDKISEFCRTHFLKVKYIVLTHGHYDHAVYIKEYKAAFPQALTVAHENEKAVLSDSEANASGLFGASCTYPMPDLDVREGDELQLGCCSGMVFKVMHTPGHTPGCICLYCKEKNILFTGDTLFVGGRGRTDFKYGDEAEILKSLRRICELDGNTVFYPGHGNDGILENERRYWM